MTTSQFFSTEWDAIMTQLGQFPDRYGFPKRVYGSVLIGSFNIRKLGSARSRNQKTWEFLAYIYRQFDLVAIQEIMDDLSSISPLIFDHLTTYYWRVRAVSVFGPSPWISSSFTTMAEEP